VGLLRDLFKVGVSANRYARREKARKDKMQSKGKDFWYIVIGWIALILIFIWTKYF